MNNIFVSAGLTVALLTTVAALVHQTRIRKALEAMLHTVLSHWRTRIEDHQPFSSDSVRGSARGRHTRGLRRSRCRNQARPRGSRSPGAQNTEIAKQNHEIAATTKHLVEADAQSRKELVGLQRDLQVQQADTLKQRDVIEVERKEIAGQRLHESTLGPVIEWSGVVLVVALVLAYCSCLAYGLRSEDGSQQVLSELLLKELADDLVPSLPRVVAVKQFSKQAHLADQQQRLEYKE